MSESGSMELKISGSRSTATTSASRVIKYLPAAGT
jgi:hypothetical protein